MNFEAVLITNIQTQIDLDAVKRNNQGRESAASRKREQERKRVDTSYDDEHPEDEENEDTGNSSDESVEEEKPKSKRSSQRTRSPEDFSDSDSLPRRGKSKTGELHRIALTVGETYILRC